MIDAQSVSSNSDCEESIASKKKRRKPTKASDTNKDSNSESSAQIKHDNLNEEEVKKKSDDLWAEFCKDLPDSTLKLSSSSSSSSLTKITEKSVCSNQLDTPLIKNEESKSKITVSKIFDFAGESVTVTEEVEADAVKEKMLKNDQCSDDKLKSDNKVISSKRPSGGLGSLLDQLKKPKMSTLQKSLIDWKDFKKNEGIEEELQQHNKSKDAYVERQAFLQRADVRQFEIEKDVRAKRRLQQSKN